MTAATFALALALSACAQPQPHSLRAQCLLDTLETLSPLSGGVVAFDDIDGQARAVSRDDWVNLKMRLGLKFPAASLTKPIIAHEIQDQISAGRMRPGSNIVDLLDIEPATLAEPRLSSITVRHLLQHSAGFDRARRGDPLWNRENLEYPLGNCAAAAEYVLRQPLDFDPGSKVSYSNAGYCVLGKLLLHGPGETEKQIRRLLKTPLGGAGGWYSTPLALHARLKHTLPIAHFPEPNPTLPDGSHYDYAWRHWSALDSPTWTHFGRLPGLLTVAASDGKEKLLVMYFKGNPDNVDAAAIAAARSSWKCMDINQ